MPPKGLQCRWAQRGKNVGTPEERIECILWQGEDGFTDLDQLESKKATPLQITESVGWAPTSWVGTYRQ
jgi:hypothetical protein